LKLCTLTANTAIITQINLFTNKCEHIIMIIIVIIGLPEMILAL